MAFPRVSSFASPVTPTIVTAALLVVALVLGTTLARPPTGTMASTKVSAHLVVLEGRVGSDGSFQVAGSDALHLVAARHLSPRRAPRYMPTSRTRSASWS